MPYKDPEAKKAYNKAYYAMHKEEILAYQKTYYDAHKEVVNTRNNAYNDAHLEELKAYRRDYYRAHKEEIKAYYAACKEEISARHKAYYETHKDEINAHSKTYRATHKEEIKAKRNAYYAVHREECIAACKAYRDTHPDEKKAQFKVWAEEHSVNIVCKQCGKHAKKFVGSGHAGKFCSLECARKWNVGPNSPGWRGGISFAPYCPKFNNALKEEVRDQFGRRCFLSGKEENGKKLAVHHCDYLKSQGCRGQRWSLLPLDHGWHAKTNANRWYWFALLRDYWAYKYLTFHGMDIYEGPDRTAWLWEMYNQDAET